MPKEQKVDIGGKVLPTHLEGKSPFNAIFTITASPAEGPDKVTRAFIDWGDETGADVPVIGGEVTVSHIYEYLQGGTQYQSKHFSPKITLSTATGYTETLPDNCVYIDVKGADVSE